MTDPSSGSRPEGWSSETRLPIPDPTVLTAKLVRDALGSYREVVEERLAAMDKATERLAHDTESIREVVEAGRERQRGDVDRQLAALREFLLTRITGLESVMGQRFETVGLQFAERDERLKQADIERQKSLDAALAAQKSDVNLQNLANTRASEKAETAAKESSGALATLMSNSISSLSEQIRRVESRLDLGEGQKSGQSEQRTERRLDTGALVSYIMIALLAIGLVVSLLARS